MARQRLGDAVNFHFAFGLGAGLLSVDRLTRGALQAAVLPRGTNNQINTNQISADQIFIDPLMRLLFRRAAVPLLCTTCLTYSITFVSFDTQVATFKLAYKC